MKGKLLTALRSMDGYISGQELCKRFGVSRTAVWKGMQKLKSEGYQIEAIPNKGYRLMESSDILSAEEIKSFQKTDWAGHPIVYFDVTDSTNIQAKRLAEDGWAHGTLVVAGCQEAGRGRRGRSWVSKKQEGIFMTILLRPDLKPEEASMLTLVAAMAVMGAIQKTLGLPAKIKWPNDIILNGKKICGILTEMSAEIEIIHYVVIGIGINVSNRQFEGELKDTATSIFLESGRQIHRARLIEAVWEEFEGCYDSFCRRKDLSELKEKYNRHLVNLNQQVRVLDPKEPFEGVARGIMPTGELIVETKEGRKFISSGEVSVRGMYGYL